MKYHVSFDIDFKRNTEKGVYIAVEGIDGTGKTTQIDRLVSYFQKEGREVVKTREPRKDVGVMGTLIQDVLYGKTNISPVAFQYLFSADRQMHHQELILPSLKEGKVVISDRCFWSAIPYGILDKEGTVDRQTVDRLLAAQSILSFYHQFTVPDITFYLQTSVAVAVQRITAGDGATEIYEDKKKLERALAGYDLLLQEFPKEFTVIDANKSVEDVTGQITAILAQRFSR